MNTIDVMGNLVKDPVIRQTKTGKNVASFTVATHRYWTDQNGEKKELTDYIDVVAWSPWADNIAQYLHKGVAVFIQGRQSKRSYEDKNKQKRWVTEVIASLVAMPIPTGGNSGGRNNRGQYGNNASYQQNSQGSNQQRNSQQGYSNQQGYGNSPDWGQFGDEVPQQGTLGGDDYPW